MNIWIIQKENLSTDYIFLTRKNRRTRKTTKQLSREVYGSRKHYMVLIYGAVCSQHFLQEQYLFRNTTK